MASFGFTFALSHTNWDAKTHATIGTQSMKALLLTALLFALATPPTVTIKVHQRQQLQATGMTGNTTVYWTSSDEATASVINSSQPKLNGTVVAHHPGTVTITATSGKDHAKTTVTVTP